MVHSRLRNRGTATAAMLCLVTGLAAQAQGARAAATPGHCTEDIDLKAESFDADYKSNTTQLRNVVISQCDIRVAARHASATGLSFDNTRWTFDGDVRIDVEKRGSLRSDQAVVEFLNNQISKATITGSPAQFEQHQSETDAMARGRARQIVYEVGAGTVRLANDAWLSYGTTEMKGPSLVYNIRQEKVQGVTQPGNGERVHITISPKNLPQKPSDKPDASHSGPEAPAPSGTPRTP